MDALGGRDHGFALHREPRQARGPVEQADAELVLQAIDRLADRRLHAAELARRGGEAAFARDRPDGTQLLDGDAFEARLHRRAVYRAPSEGGQRP